MEHFVKIVNGSHPLTTISAKHFNLDACWDSEHGFVFAGESLVPITQIIHFNPAESNSFGFSEVFREYRNGTLG